MQRVSFGQRASKYWPPLDDSNALTPRHLGASFLNLMERKKSNLCVAADLCSAKELLALVEKIGPEICLLKVRFKFKHKKYFIKLKIVVLDTLRYRRRLVS